MNRRLIGLGIIAVVAMSACGGGSESSSDTDGIKGAALPTVAGGLAKPGAGAISGGSQLMAAPALPPMGAGVVTKNGSLPQVASGNFVIFAFGDSYGSGEGNPYRPGKYDPNNNYAPTPKEVWSGNPAPGISPSGDERCHRSDASGSAKAAALVKKTYPSLTVIHKSFACSGAVAANILNATYQGTDVEASAGQNPLDPQIKQALDSGIPPESVNAIYVSVGGNDAMFADVVSECFVWHQSQCSRPYRDKVDAALKLIPGVTTKIEDVAKQLRNNFKNAFIYFSAYPDPLSVDPNDPGDVNRDGICAHDDEQGQIAWPNDYLWKINAGDARFIVDRFLAPLNKAIENGVNNTAKKITGVYFVDDHYKNKSGSAGFCSKNKTPIVRFNHEALILQGPDSDMGGGVIKVSKGGWHPSDAGYTAYGQAIFNKIDQSKAPFVSKAPLAPSDPWATSITSNGNYTITWNDQSDVEASYEVQYASGTTSKSAVLPADSSSYSFALGSGISTATFAVRACVPSQPSGENLCSAWKSATVSNWLPTQAPGTVNCATSTYGQILNGGCSVTFSVPSAVVLTSATFAYVEIRKAATVVGSALMQPGGGSVLLKYQGEPIDSTVNFVANAYLCSIVDGGKCLRGPDSPLALKVVKQDGRGLLPVNTPNLRPSTPMPSLPGVAPAPVGRPSLNTSLQCVNGKCGP